MPPFCILCRSFCNQVSLPGPAPTPPPHARLHPTPPVPFAGCRAYTVNAGADLSVGADTTTGKGTADITLTLGGYAAGDITPSNVNCALKSGTTWTCRNLVAGNNVITFTGNKAGEEHEMQSEAAHAI
jgi:hypothetical protein